MTECECMLNALEKQVIMLERSIDISIKEPLPQEFRQSVRSKEKTLKLVQLFNSMIDKSKVEEFLKNNTGYTLDEFKNGKDLGKKTRIRYSEKDNLSAQTLNIPSDTYASALFFLISLFCSVFMETRLSAYSTTPSALPVCTNSLMSIRISSFFVRKFRILITSASFSSVYAA